MGYDLDPITGGAFGNVWKCTYNDGTRSIAVAVKGFRFTVNKETSKICQSIGETGERDGHLEKTEYPNVMEFMGVAFGFGLSMVLVAPWAANGTLTDHLEKRWSTITSAEELSLYNLALILTIPSPMEISLGLTFLSSGIYRMHPRFRTIEHARRPADGTTYPAATATYPGAVRWTAPELLLSDDLQPTTLGDIYSLGSIMLRVLSGKVSLRYYSIIYVFIVRFTGWIVAAHSHS
ncbi:kinase-like domain-containing protein [Suillus paluster]|uniref:kinase-like domain-containing protein n=1 Tax=Suillus paluster TaxID=48578 RepID=UPI001B87A8B0|nr:kinase-like domain-containing protein [Suillus paluster]KAG1735950.1 kinase-like domain-containing protein [Suillus paluster]